MELKELIEKVLGAVNTGDLRSQFQKDPGNTVKQLLGDVASSLDKDTIDKIVAGVKAELTADKIAGAAGALGKVFGK